MCTVPLKGGDYRGLWSGKQQRPHSVEWGLKGCTFVAEATARIKQKKPPIGSLHTAVIHKWSCNWDWIAGMMPGPPQVVPRRLRPSEDNLTYRSMVKVNPVTQPLGLFKEKASCLLTAECVTQVEPRSEQDSRN